MRHALPLLTLLLLCTVPATAQVDYFTVASASDLMDGGTLADVEIDCMTRDRYENGPFVFYNEATGDLVTYDPDAAPGSRTTVIRSSAQLDADLGGDVTDCRSIAVPPSFGDDEVYAVLAIGDVDFVYKTDLAGSFGTVLGEADGTSGITLNFDDLLYLARVEFFGAPEDGVYTMATTGTGQTPTAVATHPDLDLYDIALSPFHGLLASSSEFGVGAFQNVIVWLDLGTNTFSVYDDPYDSGLFTNGADGGLEDVEPGSDCLCSEGYYAFNNSFGAAGGEQFAWLYPSGGERFAEESAMLADPDVTISGYDAPDGTHMAFDDGRWRMFVASIDAFGGEDAIIGMRGVPIPVELTAFDGVLDGAAVALSWATASETNNAGFEVQMRAGAGDFEALGFVEGHGTTTEAQTYAFRTDDLAPGTYAFRLKQIDFDGASQLYGDVEVTVETPGTHRLSAVYPNPFNPQARFDLAVGEAQHVRIALYNVLGQRVATLFDGRVEADAMRTFTLDGAGLATGSYVLRIEGERFLETQAVTLLR